MKNWIYKLLTAFSMTCIITILILIVYTGINYLTGVPNDEPTFAIILSLTAIYLYCRDYIDRTWK